MKQDTTVLLKKCESLPFVEIRKASRSYACYHAHSHNEFSFGVIDRGSAQYINQRKKQRIVSGNTVTINPGDIHSCNPDKSDWSYRMLFVDALWIGKLQSEMIKKNDDYQGFSRLLETDPSYYQHFNILFECLIKETNSLVSESLLIDFLEQCFFREKPIRARKDSELSPQRLSWVNEKILDELEVNHSLNDLSRESGISRYHLIRSFKQAYGLSPHALQLDARIKKAKVLLKQGYLLTDISVKLGFSDQSHFQRNFKKRLALTPKQYQNFFIF